MKGLQSARLCRLYSENSMKLRSTTASLLLCSLATTLLPSAAFGFSDVRPGYTPYAQAIESLKEKGIVEGYKDGSFKPTSHINRAEFLKIILESRGVDANAETQECFPDVHDEWFAPYVCRAKQEDIIEGYPDGSFKPEKPITFAEASKILSRAYEQNIDAYSPDWYEPFVRALEDSGAIPLSIERLEQEVNRGEMAEMMWRLTEGKGEEPSKGYLNVKYPGVMVNMASEEPQRASSCSDLKAFTEEANRGGYAKYGDAILMDRSPVASMAGARASKMQAPDFSQTNVQVNGVDEADIVKTDGTYVYAALEGTIRIVHAYPANSVELVSTIDLHNESFQPTELYIDGTKLVVLGNSWQTFNRPAAAGITKMIAPPFYGGNRTEVRIYDVADHAHPLLLRTLSFDGNLVSSRMIGKKLTVVLQESMRWRVPSPGPLPLENELVPSMRDSSSGNTEEPVSRCSDVVILPRVPHPQYLIAAVIHTDDPAAKVQKEVVLGSAENMYSSLENLYVTATQQEYHWRGPLGLGEENTSIYRFAYTDDGMELKAHGTVAGHLLNQFSMDEHNGTFRIATTNGQVWDQEYPSKSSVFILNTNLEPMGSIEDIAPGETIYSARFLGDRAYLVTFKKVDPLFVLDLSSPTEPQILGKLKIPGYSDYLHPYDENHILGFGKEAEEAKDPSTGQSADFAWYQGMKMALFDVTDPEHPVEMDTFAIGDRGTESPLLSNHKALLFDKDRQLLAFPVEIHKLTQEQKEDASSSAWGQPVFQGVYVFHLNLKDGFVLKGTISHYNQMDYLKAGSAFYGKNIERVIRLEDNLITLSAYGVQSHSLGSLNLQAEVPFEESFTTQCPGKDDPDVVYLSEDLESCSTIRFFCKEQQKAFSNACGCGCEPST